MTYQKMHLGEKLPLAKQKPKRNRNRHVNLSHDRLIKQGREISISQNLLQQQMRAYSQTYLKHFLSEPMDRIRKYKNVIIEDEPVRQPSLPKLHPPRDFSIEGTDRVTQPD